MILAVGAISVGYTFSIIIDVVMTPFSLIAILINKNKRDLL